MFGLSLFFRAASVQVIAGQGAEAGMAQLQGFLLEDARLDRLLAEGSLHSSWLLVLSKSRTCELCCAPLCRFEHDG